MSIAKAFFKFQAKVPKIELDSDGFLNGKKFRYASLGNIADKIKPVLQECGLFISHKVEYGKLVCSLVHAESGESMVSSITLSSLHSGTNAMGYGTAMTYARRYGMSALLFLITEDDNDAPEDKIPLPEKGMTEALERIEEGELAIVVDLLTAFSLTAGQNQKLKECLSLIRK